MILRVFLLASLISVAIGGILDDVKEQIGGIDLSQLKETVKGKWEESRIEESAKGILKDVQGYRSTAKGSNMCDNNTCCKLGGSQTCPMADMEQGQSNVILAPDGASAQCLYGTEYGFQVFPGNTEKLLFYFQGGGACWDRASTLANLCTSDLSPNGPEGVFDKENDQNPFKDYTIVQVLYCSGDVHGGNVTQPYKDMGKPVVQHGIDNVKQVISWVNQQGFGGDDGVLEEMVVMGCSAGSIGAQLWADIILKQYPAKLTAVVPDSYAGLFPPGSIGPYMKEFGMCDTDLVPDPIKPSCAAGNLDIQSLVISHMEGAPNTPFAFIQSKVDVVQQEFFIAVGLTTKGVSPLITPGLFYAGINGIFEMYNKVPNFVAYLIDGPKHCFTNFNVMYTANNEGPYGKRSSDEPSEGNLTLVDWLSSVPLEQEQSINTECAGKSEIPPPYNQNLKGVEVPSYSYCDPEVNSKTYTQK